MKTWDAEAALMTEWEEAAESICQKKKGSDTYGILGNSLCQWMEDKERNGRKKKKAGEQELPKDGQKCNRSFGTQHKDTHTDVDSIIKVKRMATGRDYRLN